MNVDPDKTALPFWAALAFAARCARRYADLYAADGAEPASARVAVQEAVRLAELSAARGGSPGVEDMWMEIDGQYFDNYDIDALAGALCNYAHAADNTLTDLQNCPDGGPLSRRNLAAIELAQMALEAAFREDRCEPLDPTQVLTVVECGNEDLLPEAEADLALVARLAKVLGWNDEHGVPPNVFEPLRPADGADGPAVTSAVK